MTEPDDETTRGHGGGDRGGAVLEPGDEFAGYRIEALLGVGGMGRVYLAVEPEIGRRVAMKVLIPEISSDERQRARFKREARTAAALDHPHVIPIYDADEADGQLYLTMRVVEGDDLRDFVKRVGPLEPDLAVRILAQVCDALDYAHEAGLVHRDIKPANVLLGGTDEAPHAYLTDFSLVTGGEGEETLTKAGSIVGTLDYASPEQIQAQRADLRSDVYALTCVLVYMLTGRPPYPRDSEPAIMWGHLGEPPPVVSEVRPGLSPLWDQVVVRGMAKAPEDRFPSAGYLADAAKLAASA